MDAWRFIVRSESHRNSVEAYLPLILSAAGSLGVLPFAILRFLQGDWVAAVMDTMIVVGFFAFGTYVYVTRRVRVASIAIAAICAVGVLATVYVIGPQQVYWAFPALIGIFYLLRAREAVALAIFTLFALLPALLGSADSKETTTVIVTIIVTGMIAFAFSLITSRQREQLLVLATKDPLTGAGNRRGLDAKLAEVVNSFKRTAANSSLILLDLVSRRSSISVSA
jgi:hypothetical protein